MLSLFSILEGVDKSFFNEAKNGKFLSLLKDDNVPPHDFATMMTESTSIVESLRGHRELHRSLKGLLNLNKVAAFPSEPLRSFPFFYSRFLFLVPTRSRAHPFSLPFSAAVRPSSNQSIRCHFPSADHTSPRCRIGVSCILRK